MNTRECVLGLFFSALGLPFLALGLLGLAWLFGLRLGERSITRLAVAATALSLLSLLAATGLGLAFGLFPLEAGPWPWFSAGHHTFEISFRWDLPAIVVAVTIGLVGAIVTLFSVDYLHREGGLLRYFFLLLLFLGAIQLLVVSGSYDQLFIGWELVGLTSVFLIAFFQERPQPVRAAIRALIAYRFCDLGLLLGAVLMHQTLHGTRYGHLDLSQLTPATTTTLALLLLLGASGKAAQLPFGGWLPRAMEGPTPSSAVFYGALSVHAGIYLLIRAEPFFTASPVASFAALLVGGSTAFYGATLARVQADAKSQLAYASMAQLGVMVVEIGLHLPTLALVHLVGHACLRGTQMLRAPSLMHDTIQLSRALGLRSLAIGSMPVPNGVFRVLRDGLYIELLAERFIVRPLLEAGRFVERLELSWEGKFGPRVEPRAPEPPEARAEAREGVSR